MYTFSPHFKVTYPNNFVTMEDGFTTVAIPAEGAEQAIYKAIEEHIANVKLDFKNDDIRQEYARHVRCAATAVDVSIEFKKDLAALFGIAGNIDLNALTQVLGENRERICSPG